MASFEHIAQRLFSGPVPNIGGAKPVSLEQALARVTAAENELQNARAAARQLARASGKRISGLFSGDFVTRDTATLWTDQARREGFDEGYTTACVHYEKAFNGPSPFAIALHRRHLGDAPAAALDPVAARQQEILESRRVSLASNANIGAPTTSEGLAAGIHEAAAKARTPTGEHRDDKAETNALSAAIVAAGRRRRNEER